MSPAVRPIIACRPEPGLAATLAAGQKAGLLITGVPLFEVRPVAWDPPEPSRFSALLIGSANAIRHAGSALADYRQLPVHAVGRMTASAALEAGLHVAERGEGGLQQLLDGTVAAQHFLRLAGEAHVALDSPSGSTITTRIVYDSAALPMPVVLADLLRGNALVLLHSGVAAAHFAAECDRLDIDRQSIALAALAPRIAAAAGEGWAAVRSAETPHEAALLALARDMCH